MAPEGQDGDDGEKSGKKDRDEGESREQDGMRAGPNGGSEIGGKGEEGTGKSLGGAVSGEEGLLVNPSGGDDGAFQEREHDVASAEDERPGAIEGVEDGDGLGFR